jgi:oxygen-independent coproporphyrinogen-3 oxidase
MLRDAGLMNFNIDLIAGLPGQTRESWRESLDWVSRLAPPHVSVYLFEADEDSALGRESLLGGVRYSAAILPNDELAAEFYETAVAHLAHEGLNRYEISNFAQPGFESLHNLKYWKLEPYFGFGVDAHSFDGQRRWANPDTLPEYLAQVAGDSAATPDYTATDHEEERFFVGLRLASGVEPTTREWQRFRMPIDRGLAAGFLVQDGPRLRLTDRGFLASNELFQEFLV